MAEHTSLTLAGIGIIAIACQWIAWRVKLPAILFLLLAGIVAGPVTHWLQPDELFGNLLFPFIELSVAVILFEGSLSLHFDEIRGLERVVRRLVSTGLLVTWTVVTLATRYFLDFPWPLAVLFGAITVVTGPTVIVPMLRTVRPNQAIANILRWEGIIIDPIGALLTVLVFDFIVSSGTGHAFGHTLTTFAGILAAGTLLGVGGGYLLGTLLRRHWIPEYLHNVATLTLVIGVFALANATQSESGLLAVTLMGLWMANMKGVPVEDILDFKESLSVLLISGLFIILAARIDFQQFTTLGWGAVSVFLVIQFVARPLKASVASWGSSLSWPERALIGWIAPRGIVAAAMAALLALKLEALGYQEAPLLVPLTFMVIIGTVVLQSATAGTLAARLGVAEPDPKGFLIIGANPVARAVASALNGKGYRTLLVDNEWANIRAALMEGHNTFYGNPVSEHADRNLDLVGIGHLLALSPRAEINALAATRYQREFGADAIYRVRPAPEKVGKESEAKEAKAPGQMLFDRSGHYGKLSELLSTGAKIRSTKLTENFDFSEYYKTHYTRGVPLFAIDSRGRLRPFTHDSEFKPQPGWTILGLNPPKEEASEPQSNPGKTDKFKDAKDPAAESSHPTPSP